MTKRVEEEPWQFSSRTRRWASLFVVSVCCACASGPVMSWPTLEPLMQAQGVFKSRGESDEESNAMYNAVYGMSNVVMFLISLPSGILYDTLGGKACGIIGCIGAAIGLLLMSIACTYAHEYDWLLFIGYPLATASGLLNSNSIYTFIWLLPEDQNLISGIASGSLALSDMLALVAVWLHSKYQLPISTFFLAFSCLCLLTTLIYNVFVPTKEYMTFLAEEVMRLKLSLNADGDGGVGEDIDIETTTSTEILSTIVKPPIETVFDKILRAWKALCERKTLSILIITFSSFYFMSIVYPIQMMYAYYQAIFPAVDSLNGVSHTAISLVNTFAIVYGCGGFLSAVFGGKMCDKIGLVNFTYSIFVCSILSTTFLLIPTELSQILSQVLLTFGVNLYSIVILRYCMLYASPDLFGTLSGLIFLIISMIMACGYTILYFLFNSGTQQYMKPFLLLGILASISGLALAVYWSYRPPPGEMNQDSSTLDTTHQGNNEYVELLPIQLFTDGDIQPLDNNKNNFTNKNANTKRFFCSGGRGKGSGSLCFGSFKSVDSFEKQKKNEPEK